MRHLKLAVAVASGLVIVAMTGEALAAKVAHKRSPAVVTQNSDPDFLAMIGSVMPFSNDEAEKFRHGPVKQDTNKYLNATPQPVRAQDQGIAGGWRRDHAPRLSGRQISGRRSRIL